MDKTRQQHLSFLILYDAAHKAKRIKTHHWAHLRQCQKCLLRLAGMLQIHRDLQDLSKYSAA
jgi:hypothetical protein